MVSILMFLFSFGIKTFETAKKDRRRNRRSDPRPGLVDFSTSVGALVVSLFPSHRVGVHLLGMGAGYSAGVPVPGPRSIECVWGV